MALNESALVRRSAASNVRPPRSMSLAACRQNREVFARNSSRREMLRQRLIQHCASAVVRRFPIASLSNAQSSIPCSDYRFSVCSAHRVRGLNSVLVGNATTKQL